MKTQLKIPPKKKPKAVAIIGAGISGLSCAQTLQDAGIPTRVFESSTTVGGRCATQLWQGHLVDIGVQFFTAQTNEFKKELLTRLRQFRPIISPILDEKEHVIKNEGNPRFYVLQGNNYFTHVLSQGLDLRLNSPVDSATFSPSGIEILGETYRAVVSAVPGPLTSRIFGLGKAPVDYEPSLVALLEYAGLSIGTSRKCYARQLPDNGHAVRFSSCENNKVGRIVGNKTVFVVQASTSFSHDHAKEPVEKYMPKLVKEHEKLWGIPAGKCTAHFGHRWRHGHPKKDHRREIELPEGAFICGDTRAESTVESVWLDGRRAAQEVLLYLAES